MSIHGILLAGGQSIRMGTNKALLSVDEFTLIEHIAMQMHLVCDSLTIVLGEKNPYQHLFSDKVKFVSDIYPNLGPLSGIHAGLQSIPDGGIGFLMACDMPFVSPQLLEQLKDNLESDIEVVTFGDQPFHALYRKSVSLKAENCLVQGKRKLTDFISTCTVKKLPLPNEDIVFGENLNTPEQYASFMMKRRT